MEYKIVEVKEMSKKSIIKEAEDTMNNMAKEGWKVVATTEFMAVEFGYTLLITFERN